jgi:hypothetical protein
MKTISSGSAQKKRQKQLAFAHQKDKEGQAPFAALNR